MTGRLKFSPSNDLAISIVLLGLWATYSVIQHWNTWPPDLASVYMAARFFDMGSYDLVYASSEHMSVWRPELAAMGRPDVSVFRFLYPPLWVAVVGPLTRLSPEAFFNIFYIYHHAVLAISVILAFRIIRPIIPLYVWTLTSIGLLSISLIAVLALHHNQFQITLTFFTLLAFERYRSGAMIMAGAALAVAAAIKITPAALGLIFLLDRQYRAAIATVVAGIVLLALSVTLAGVDLHFDFLNSLQTISNRVSVEIINWNIESYLMQLASLISDQPLGPAPLSNLKFAKPVWVTVTTYLIFTVGLIAVILRTKDQPNLRLMGLILLITLTAPLAWVYHYLTILLLLPIVFVYMPLPRAVLALVVIGFLTSLRVFGLIEVSSPHFHMQPLLSTSIMIALLGSIIASPRIRRGKIAPVLAPRT